MSTRITYEVALLIPVSGVLRTECTEAWRAADGTMADIWRLAWSHARYQRDRCEDDTECRILIHEVAARADGRRLFTADPEIPRDRTRRDELVRLARECRIRLGRVPRHSRAWHALRSEAAFYHTQLVRARRNGG